MNSITICGNLTKDAEMRYMPDGTAVAGFSVADNQGKDKPAIFWNCSIFGKRAESLEQYLSKGQTVTVIGSIAEREWEDRSGNKRKQQDVRVVEIALQGGRKDDSKLTGQPTSKRAAPASSDMDDDIPF